MEHVGGSSSERLPEASDAPTTDKLTENSQILPPDVSVLSLVDFRYTSGTCAASFYLRYRDRFTACLSKKGDGDQPLTEDERLGPAGEDLLLLHVLGLIDRRLPAHVRDLYSPRLGDSSSRRLVDFRYDTSTGTVPYGTLLSVRINFFYSLILFPYFHSSLFWAISLLRFVVCCFYDQYLF